MAVLLVSILVLHLVTLAMLFIATLEKVRHTVNCCLNMLCLSLQYMLRHYYVALPCLTLYFISRGVTCLHYAKCFSTDKTHRAHRIPFGHIFH